MTSLRQIESNRRNALKSTGPKTETGKQHASQNAVRHGLTAETVIVPFEDSEDYETFEQAVTADYDAETAVQRELVLRLASLLWRLRRATSIETGLLQIQGEILRDANQAQRLASDERTVMQILRLGRPAAGIPPTNVVNNCNPMDREAGSVTETKPAPRILDVPRCFLRLANLDNGVFERLGRYEAALWRQVRQTLFTLEQLRWPKSGARNWRTQRSRHRAMELRPGPDW